MTISSEMTAGGSIGYDREVLLYSKKPEQKNGAIPQVLSYFKRVWNSSDCKTVFEGDPQREKTKSEIKYLSRRYQSIKKKLPSKTDWVKQTVPVKKASFVTTRSIFGNNELMCGIRCSSSCCHAKKDVTIQTPYAVFSKDMYKGMEELTGKVPNVEMLVNSTAVGDNFIASSDYTRNRSKVLKTGPRVYEFFGDHSLPRQVHCHR